MVSKKRYISEMNEIYEITVESCRDGYLIRVDGWPMDIVGSMQEAEQMEARIARDLILSPICDDL